MLLRCPNYFDAFSVASRLSRPLEHVFFSPKKIFMGNPRKGLHGTLHSVDGETLRLGSTRDRSGEFIGDKVKALS